MKNTIGWVIAILVILVFGARFIISFIPTENHYKETQKEDDTNKNVNNSSKDSFSDGVSITESYYDNTTSDENIVTKEYRWRQNFKVWSAKWEVPQNVIQEAEQDLINLENIAKYGYEEDDNSSGNVKYYKTITNDWSSPEEFWSAVYKVIRNDNEGRVKLISDVLKNAIKKNKLTSYDALNMILPFIQNIYYEIPKNYFELLPPVNSIMENRGDCDTKSILLAMILEDLGYNALVLYSSQYLHAMVAVDLGGYGECIEYKNVEYSFIETTTEGWQIGMISPDMSDLRYWYCIDI
jgi:hypothetical protein